MNSCSIYTFLVRPKKNILDHIKPRNLPTTTIRCFTVQTIDIYHWDRFDGFMKHLPRQERMIWTTASLPNARYLPLHRCIPPLNRVDGCSVEQDASLFSLTHQILMEPGHNIFHKTSDPWQLQLKTPDAPSLLSISCLWLMYMLVLFIENRLPPDQKPFIFTIPFVS